MDWSAATNLFLLLIAPFVGSFLDVVGDRWPRRDAIAMGRSRCRHCCHVLGWRDLVPILSWCVARGRCRYCRAAVSIRHPITEIAALGLAIWSFVQLPGPISWITVLFGWMLLTIAIIDLRWLWLPNILSFSLGFSGLVVTWLVKPSSIFDHLIGVVAGYVILATAARIYRRYRGREGLGGGDATLFGAIGAWVGWQGLGTVLLYAGIAGMLILLIQAQRGQRVHLATRLPFGSHLCLGAWLVWLYGPLYIE
jgi:leader peptidase (prepilin peptidase) / N-methyltransferase